LRELKQERNKNNSKEDKLIINQWKKVEDTFKNRIKASIEDEEVFIFNVSNRIVTCFLRVWDKIQSK